MVENLNREELLKLVQVYAKNWLAHDGCGFLAAEETLGLEKAIELDAKAWERFAVAEAKRIMRAFDIPEGGGLQALERALRYRLYASINNQEIEWQDDRTMTFRMIDCRVQQSREAKNLPPFPCDSVGIVEFSQFAKTIDSRINTRCISCPPTRAENYYCAWEFTL